MSEEMERLFRQVRIAMVLDWANQKDLLALDSIHSTVERLERERGKFESALIVSNNNTKRKKEHIAALEHERGKTEDRVSELERMISALECSRINYIRRDGKDVRLIETDCGAVAEPCEECGAGPRDTEGEQMMKMYVWSNAPFWLAVAQAESVDAARKALLDTELGDSGDGSCPVHDKAREMILGEGPTIWGMAPTPSLLPRIARRLRKPTPKRQSGKRRSPKRSRIPARQSFAVHVATPPSGRMRRGNHQ